MILRGRDVAPTLVERLGNFPLDLQGCGLGSVRSCSPSPAVTRREATRLVRWSLSYSAFFSCFLRKQPSLAEHEQDGIRIVRACIHRRPLYLGSGFSWASGGTRTLGSPYRIALRVAFGPTTELQQLRLTLPRAILQGESQKARSACWSRHNSNFWVGVKDEGCR